MCKCQCEGYFCEKCNIGFFVMFWYFSDDIMHTDHIFHALLLEPQITFSNKSWIKCFDGKIQRRNRAYPPAPSEYCQNRALVGITAICWVLYPGAPQNCLEPVRTDQHIYDRPPHWFQDVGEKRQKVSIEKMSFLGKCFYHLPWVQTMIAVNKFTASFLFWFLPAWR